MNGAGAYDPRRGPRAPFLRLAGIGLVVLVSAIVIMTAPLLLRASASKGDDSTTAPTAAISPATMTTTAFAGHVSSLWEEEAATTFAYDPVESAEESHYHPTALKAKASGSTHYHSERRGSESRSSSSEGKGSNGKGPSSSSSEGRVSSHSSKGKGSSSSERTAPSAASQGKGPTSGKGGTIYHGHHASPVAPPSPVRLILSGAILVGVSHYSSLPPQDDECEPANNDVYYRPHVHQGAPYNNYYPGESGSKSGSSGFSKSGKSGSSKSGKSGSPASSKSGKSDSSGSSDAGKSGSSGSSKSGSSYSSGAAPTGSYSGKGSHSSSGYSHYYNAHTHSRDDHFHHDITLPGSIVEVSCGTHAALSMMRKLLTHDLHSLCCFSSPAMTMDIQCQVQHRSLGRTRPRFFVSMVSGTKLFSLLRTFPVRLEKTC